MFTRDFWFYENIIALYNLLCQILTNVCPVHVPETVFVSTLTVDIIALIPATQTRHCPVSTAIRNTQKETSDKITRF